MKYCLLFYFALISSLYANPYLEPYFGHDLNGEAENKVSTGEVYKWEFEGTHLGIKAGYSFWNSLIFGLEFEVSRFGFRGLSYEAAYTNERMHGSLWGLFAMYRFPTWVKIYTSYLFYSHFKYDEGVSDNDKLIGDGFIFGLGFIQIPNLDINFEYRVQTLSKYFNNSTEKTNPLNHPYNVNQILVTLSFPILF
jgi:hypothetical protein